MSNINQIVFEVMLASHSAGHELFVRLKGHGELMCVKQFKLEKQFQFGHSVFLKHPEFLSANRLLLYFMYIFTFSLRISCFSDLSVSFRHSSTHFFLSPQQDSEIDYRNLMFTAET